jgi:tRNA (cytidine/uridine-2'-O-)-methyltransferase
MGYTTATMIEIALYQPDIAPNVGTIARLCACLSLPLTIIEPAGFPWNDSSLRRAGMDYLDQVNLVRAASWSSFQETKTSQRLILLTTKSTTPYTIFQFQPGDILLMGRESAGVPEAVHDAAHARLTIPMKQGPRSLNVALACAMVTGEAMRQLS